MIIRIASLVAMGSVLSLTSNATVGAPHIDKLEQNTRTVQWLQVGRATVAQKSSRTIRLTGPWMDAVTSATTSNGVSARNIVRDWPNQKVTMVLDASESAARGDMTLKLNITCPTNPSAFGVTVTVSDCAPSINLPVKVFETGPIVSIYPNGVVPANAAVTFDLTGEALNVATLLSRLVSLRSASILSKSATTMRVRGTTPGCGYVTVALTDVADGDENPYRSPTVQPILAGTLCGGSSAPTTMRISECPPGQTFDPVNNVCKP